MDEQVLEYLDEAKIEDVNDSCDFVSAIQTCIVDLETAFNSRPWEISKSGIIGFAICGRDAAKSIVNSLPSQIAETQVEEVLREFDQLVSVLGEL